VLRNPHQYKLTSFLPTGPLFALRSFYSIVPVLLCQRTVTTKAFHTTFLIVAPWLLFNIVMAVLLIQSYQCDPNARGGEEDEGETNDDGLSQDKVGLEEMAFISLPFSGKVLTATPIAG